MKIGEQKHFKGYQLNEPCRAGNHSLLLESGGDAEPVTDRPAHVFFMVLQFFSQDVGCFPSVFDAHFLPGLSEGQGYGSIRSISSWSLQITYVHLQASDAPYARKKLTA